MIPIKRLGVQCCNCGNFNTYENTTNMGKTVWNGYYCANCGNAFTDGTEKSHIKYTRL